MAIFVAPNASNYHGLDRGFNQRFKLDDSLGSGNAKEGVYVVSDANDIMTTLNDIHSAVGISSGDVRAISGGHCYENFVAQQASEGPNYTRYLLDLSMMKGVYEETVGGTEYIVIEPGVSNWQAQSTLFTKYGAALPGGSCYSVAAGGHIAGGGYGLLSRLHGTTVDYLAGVEMVIPSSSGSPFQIHRLDGPGANLINRASRGGGAGHFGIITKYYFEKSKLPPAPEGALFITLPVPWGQFTGVGGAANFAAYVKAYYDACNALPPQAFTLGKFTYMTPSSDSMSIVMQVVYGRGSGHDDALGGAAYPEIDKPDADDTIAAFCNALGQWLNPPMRSGRRGEKFHILGHPVNAAIDLDSVYDLPWIEMTQLLNGSGENQNGKYKSSYMKQNFNDAEAYAMRDFLMGNVSGLTPPDAADLSQTLIQIDSYGAQVNEIARGDNQTVITARESVLKLQYQTYWKTTEGSKPDDNTEIITWFNEGYNYIHNQAQNGQSGFPLWGDKYQGCYFNYPDIQIGVNDGHSQDPGEQYSGDFEELYFGAEMANFLRQVKTAVDPDNLFSFAQSIRPSEG